MLEHEAEVQVMEAETSEKALKLARRIPEFDLVISDIVRPGMDGLAFLKIFKKEHPTVPVMIVSGELNAAFRRKAYRLGAVACLQKPVDRKRFIAAAVKTLST